MRLKLGISDCYAWNFVAAFLVLRGAFFPRYGVSSLLGIAVLSEGFSACHACYQFLTGVIKWVKPSSLGGRSEISSRFETSRLHRK